MAESWPWWSCLNGVPGGRLAFPGMGSSWYAPMYLKIVSICIDKSASTDKVDKIKSKQLNKTHYLLLWKLTTIRAILKEIDCRLSSILWKIFEHCFLLSDESNIPFHNISKTNKKCVHKKAKTPSLLIQLEIYYHYNLSWIYE